MKRYLTAVRRFVKEEDAPTMVEYGLLVVFIALIVVVGANVFGSALRDLFSAIGGAVRGTSSPTLPAPGSG